MQSINVLYLLHFRPCCTLGQVYCKSSVCRWFKVNDPSATSDELGSGAGTSFSERLSSRPRGEMPPTNISSSLLSIDPHRTAYGGRGRSAMAAGWMFFDPVYHPSYAITSLFEPFGQEQGRKACVRGKTKMGRRRRWKGASKMTPSDRDRHWSRGEGTQRKTMHRADVFLEGGHVQRYTPGVTPTF